MISSDYSPPTTLSLSKNSSAARTSTAADDVYQNPIIHADYSDPDVIRFGDDFYMIASSFNCTPGLPILHSHDLINWRLVNHAVKQLPHPRFFSVQPGQGIWAPSIRFHESKFWIFFPMPDEGIYLITANHPEDTWSEPHLVIEGKGLIDPCPLWDEDGKAYLVHAYAKSRSGIKHRLRVSPMAPDGSRLLGEGHVVFHDPIRHPTLEGPKFLKKDGWYYILAPAGGVATGWQVALRSRHIYGPYEDRILLQQGSTQVNGPHQGALVDLPNGEWWFIHFQDVGLCGRIVHLQPVTWRDGWPLMGEITSDKEIGIPVLSYRKPKVSKKVPLPASRSFEDDFTSSTLNLEWQWHANHRDSWFSLTENPGHLRLYPQELEQGDLASAGNLLLQKFPARNFSVETMVTLHSDNVGDSIGLVVMGTEHAFLGMRAGPKTGQFRIVYVINNAEKVSYEYIGNKVTLGVQINDEGLCTFSFKNADDPIHVLPERFAAKAGMWIGAKVGLVATSVRSKGIGYGDVDYFRMSVT